MNLCQLTSSYENVPNSKNAQSSDACESSQQAKHSLTTSKSITPFLRNGPQSTINGGSITSDECSQPQGSNGSLIIQESLKSTHQSSSPTGSSATASRSNNAEHTEQSQFSCSSPSPTKDGGRSWSQGIARGTVNGQLQSSEISGEFSLRGNRSGRLWSTKLRTEQQTCSTELSESIKESVQSARSPWNNEEQSSSNSLGRDTLDGKLQHKEAQPDAIAGKSRHESPTSRRVFKWEPPSAASSTGSNNTTGELQQIQPTGISTTKTAVGAPFTELSNRCREDKEASSAGKSSSSGTARVPSIPELSPYQSECFKGLSEQGRDSFTETIDRSPTSIPGRLFQSSKSLPGHIQEPIYPVNEEGTSNGIKESKGTSSICKGSFSRAQGSTGREGSDSTSFERSNENVIEGSYPDVLTRDISTHDRRFSPTFEESIPRVLQRSGSVERVEGFCSRVNKGSPSGDIQRSSSRDAQRTNDKLPREVDERSNSRVNSGAQELNERRSSGDIKRFSATSLVFEKQFTPIYDGETNTGKDGCSTSLYDGKLTATTTPTIAGSSRSTNIGQPPSSNLTDGSSSPTSCGSYSAGATIGCSFISSSSGSPAGGGNESPTSTNAVSSATAGSSTAASVGRTSSSPSIAGSPDVSQDGSSLPCGNGGAAPNGGGGGGRGWQNSVQQTELASIRASCTTGASRPAGTEASAVGVTTNAAAAPASSRLEGQRRGPASGQEEKGQHGRSEGEGGLWTHEGEAPPTKEAAKGILAIDKAAVHRICSGQVVVNLGTAVKELVENSLDAGSGSVEVRLTGYGAANITVIDDGPGVPPSDFEALALKHHTSKLRDFGGLCGVSTFGFRGEALSSLCALGKLTVCTRHSSQPVATQLIYDSNGRLAEQRPVSRQVGTTVSVSSLFSSLPVRKKEFERNLKKEYNKMLQVLYSYAIISTNVRLQVSNQTESNSRRHTVLATSCHPSLRENITAVYGAKQASSLLLLEQSSEETAADGDSAGDGSAVFRLEGLVSSCAHGSGRSAPDRQFYYINNRPCDPVKVSRVMNEVYHSYNRHQYPVVVLNITTSRDSVDVNLTPDKRQVMMHHEALLLAQLKSSLHRLYEDIPTYTVALKTKLALTPKTLKNSSPRMTMMTPLHKSTFSQSIDFTPKSFSSSPSSPQILSSPKTLSLEIKGDDATLHCVPITQRSYTTPSTEHSALASQSSPAALPVNSSATETLETTCSKQTCSPAQTLHQKTLESFATHKTTTQLTKTPPQKSKLSSLSSRFARISTPTNKTLTPPPPQPLPSGSPANSSTNSYSVNSNTYSNTGNNNNNSTSNNKNTSSSNNSCNKRASSAVADDQHQSPRKKHPRLDLMENKENSSMEHNFVKSPSSMVEGVVDYGDDDFFADDGLLSVAEAEQLDGKSEGFRDSADAGLDIDVALAQVEQENEVTSGVAAGSGGKTLPISGNCGSKKSIKAHDATDQFLHRLVSKKLNSGSNYSSTGHKNVRKCLQKFLFNSTIADEADCMISRDGDEDASDDVKVVFEGEMKTKDNHQANVSVYDAEKEMESDEVESDIIIEYDDKLSSEASRHNKKAKVVQFSLSKLRERFEKRRLAQEDEDRKLVRNFHAKIVPTDNRAAEEELNKVLSKHMFAKMKILGQFNLGFIITRLNSDLFIIDQHATDEKYNFEMLQQTCILQHQPLISPQLLELTPGNEAILLDNIDIFTANGFRFDIDESLSFGHRVQLKSVPQNRNWIFGKDDIEELIFMLSDSPGSMCRPSRVRAMFASRACRKSVMVGSALSAAGMRELVQHMGQIEQPWSCPHGRPTVRHLLNLDMIAHDPLV